MKILWCNTFKVIRGCFLIGFASNLFAQGSGKDINFTAGLGNPSVSVKATFPNLTTDFSITAWVNTTNNAQIGQRIFQDDESKAKGYGFSLGDPGAGRLRFYSRGTSTTAISFLADGNIVLNNNVWYHIAAVVNIVAKTVSIYVNGVLDVTVADGRAGTFGTDPGNASFGGESPASGEFASGFYVRGNLDEVTVYNKAITQAEVQTSMCLKQTAATIPGTGSMRGYWNLDAAVTGANNVADNSGNGMTGTMNNLANANVITSGASLGDASVFIYTPATWAGQTLTLPAAGNGTTFTVSTITPVNGPTAPTGVQLYQVNAVPSITTNILGLGNNNVYYGVYEINGTAPGYTATIDFTNYIQTNNAQVYTRQNNAAVWAAGNTNVANVFTIATGETSKIQQEFILGTTSNANPLPVQLLSFTAVPDINKVDLNWETASETNNRYFTIERSGDAQSFSEILMVNSRASNGNSIVKLGYSATDEKPLTGISYYRLKQTDYNGRFKYFNIVSVDFIPKRNITFSIYPNPNTGQFTLDFSGIENNHEVQITMQNELGEVVYSDSVNSNSISSNKVQITPSGRLASGKYFCSLAVEEIKHTLVVVIN